MIIKKRFLRLMLATVGILSATAAIAADYDPPVFEAPAADEEYVPVEVGSGWYLRGDVSYDFNRSFKDGSASGNGSIFDNDFIGLVRIGPMDPVTVSEDISPFSGSVGFGYHWNDYIRTDVTFGISPTDNIASSGRLGVGYVDGPMINWADPGISSGVNGVPDYGCSGTRTITYQTAGVVEVPPGPVVENDWRRDCNASAQYQASSYNGLANAYVDLGTFAGLTPYFGAGVGVTYSKTRFAIAANCESYDVTTPNGPADPGTETRTQFTCDQASSSSTYSKKEYNLTYALMAGLAYNVTKNVAIDVGYQYKNTPEFKYYVLSNSGVESRKGFDSHTVKVGLRYDLW